eukprot:6769393-Alexandrium_andersonii.AAC.1
MPSSRLSGCDTPGLDGFPLGVRMSSFLGPLAVRGADSELSANHSFIIVGVCLLWGPFVRSPNHAVNSSACPQTMQLEHRKT